MDKLKAIWDNASNLGRAVIVGTAIVFALLVVGAVAGDPESDDGDQATPIAKVENGSESVTRGADRESVRQPEEQAARDQREQPDRPVVAPAPEDWIREALGDEVSSDFAVGDSEVRSVQVTGQLVDVTLSTPEGGFEGPSTDDTDGLASSALAKVYDDANWQGAAFVEFRGGLVDSATGRDLPNAPTANYRVERGAAKRIDWADDEVLFIIDWSIYRGLCHPALKGC